MNNIYNSTTVAPSTPTVVNGFTVPVRAPYSLKGLVIWSEVDCDVSIYINVDKKGGGRISGSVQTLFLDFSASPFGLLSSDVVSIQVTQMDASSHIVSSTILVEQL